MSKIRVIGAVSGVVAKASGKVLLKCKKYSPEILLAGGILCGIGAVVSAVCNTKKAMEDETLAELDQELDNIQKKEADGMKAAEADGVLKEAKKDIIVVSRKASLNVFFKILGRYFRIYWLTMTLLLLAIGLCMGSHGILNTRYLGTAAAYTALDESFKDYRRRNAEQIGEEAEKKFYNGLEDTAVSTVDPETGKKKKETVQKLAVKDRKQSPYEFDFNRFTAPMDWTPNQDHNFTFIRQVQALANDKLNAQGHLFLNEVLDDLGMSRTQAGAVVGWIVNGDGDGYVDFGCHEYYTDEISDINEIKDIHLNFNVDGLIYDKI